MTKMKFVGAFIVAVGILGSSAGLMGYTNWAHAPLKAASLAPPGEHLVILQTSVERVAQMAQEGDIADRILQMGEQVLPGLRRHPSCPAPRCGTIPRS